MKVSITADLVWYVFFFLFITKQSSFLPEIIIREKTVHKQPAEHLYEYLNCPNVWHSSPRIAVPVDFYIPASRLHS